MTHTFYEDNLEETTVVSDRMGFNVAYGITNFDGSSEFIEDPSIGVFEASYRSYGSGEDPNTVNTTILNLSHVEIVLFGNGFSGSSGSFSFFSMIAPSKGAV